MMREEVRSSGTMDPVLLASSSSPAPTTLSSSAGASSPAVPANSKGGSLSCVGSHPPRASMSISAGCSAVGTSQPSCRPWERGDILKRLATFKPCNWSGKPKVVDSMACARKGWVNVDVDQITCESCGAHLIFSISPSWSPFEVDCAVEDFTKQLDAGHSSTCPWKGTSCAESLAQFPPTPPSALVGGFKDRCDGLLQFLSLPIISASAIEHMRKSRSMQLEHFLSQTTNSVPVDVGIRDGIPVLESSREETLVIYSHSQKIISLCGWEPRWLSNVQDCEEHSAESTRNACSFSRTKDRSHNVRGNRPGRKSFSASAKGKKKVRVSESKSKSRSPLLDCTLCGATVRIWDFICVPRPTYFSSDNVNIPVTSKKLILTRGVSAASGISGRVAPDGADKEQNDIRDEAATSNIGKPLVSVDLNLTMSNGLPSTQFGRPETSGHFGEEALGRDLTIRQPSGSEVGDRAASYESRGPSSRKRSFEERGSTVDRPPRRMQQTNSIEGTMNDRDGDEVNDASQYSGRPSKRPHNLYECDIPQSSHRRDASTAGPSNFISSEVLNDINPSDSFRHGPRDSARASSVVAMDTTGHNAEEYSMESVENSPGDIDDVTFPSSATYRNADNNDVSELNFSIQAQQSTCYQPDARRIAEQMGVSSTNNCEEVLNAETVNTHARDRFSFGISGGSVGMGASHEAEIHGADISVHRADSVVGDAETVAEVTENQGLMGESTVDRGLTDEFVPVELGREDDPHGDSQEMMSHSIGRVDSGSNIYGPTKAESVESEEKICQSQAMGFEIGAQPSLSCNAVIYSACETSKEEVTQMGHDSVTYDFIEIESLCGGTNGTVNRENYFGTELKEFDPIKHHNYFCPWVNGTVAAAGCCGSDSNGDTCGWQLTLDALDAFQIQGHILVQTTESASAASLYKDDEFKLKKQFEPNSASKSLGT